jgi:sugar-specific transcriptional regulator TrmB
VSGDFDVAGTAKALSLYKVGTPFEGKIREGVVYRLKKVPQSPVRYPYLVVSDNAEPTDVLTVNDFSRFKERLKKKVKKGAGLEVVVAPARKMDAASVGRWFDNIKELYSFCHSSRCQFILSSGAASMHEMVSGQSLDAILRKCNIDPEKHWREMNSWLEIRLSRRVSV